MKDQVAQQAADAAIASTASKVTYTGAGMTISGWFLSSEFAVLVGILLGMAGFLVNWHYRHKENLRQQAQDLRSQAEHELRMQQLRDSHKPD
jgi:predicted negative regulator of RcsB-dependent stress response